MIKGKIVFKSLSSNPDYTLLTPEGFVVAKQQSTKTDYAIGEIVEADSENASKIEVVEDSKLEKEIRDFVEKNSKPQKAELLVKDEAMQKFEARLEEGAEFVARKLWELTPSLIRFNDDCDGISAGLNVRKAIENFALEKKIPLPKNFLRDKQCNSAVYEQNEVFYDIDEMSVSVFGRKPLLFLCDFGANEESVAALEKAKENFEIIIIDHHVYSKKAKALSSFFLNPLEFGGKSSHTTGLIAYEFAERLSQGEKLYALLSLESDKSVFWDNVERKEALVLDFLSSGDFSLDKYERELKEGTQFYWLEAKNKIQAAAEKALQKVKEIEVTAEKEGRKEKALIVIASLEGIVKKNEFPPKGKILNKVQDHFEKTNELVVGLSFDSTTIQFRVSKALHSKGFKATEIIEEVKKEFSGISGGGHEQAAAMRFGEDYARTILEKTIELSRKKIQGIL